MKVTVKPKQTEKSREIPFDEIPPRSVYKISNEVVLLKVNAENAVILVGHEGCDYFSMAGGYKTYPAVKILGKLTEVIVEEV